MKTHTLSEKKMDRHIGNLNRMATFYQEKSEVAPEYQAKLFVHFAASLIYAVTVIKMHQKLAKKLSEEDQQ